MNNNIIDQLKKRGFIFDIANHMHLLKYINVNKITLYCGFDPTADSLHLGHLLPLLCLRRFQLAGHKVIILIGGATSIIGDPSFKKQERKSNTKTKIFFNWETNIINQISSFINFRCTVNKAIIVNNRDWLNKFNVIDFLCKIGTHFSINSMINKASVRERIQRLGKGISFTEFSYSLLQAYDFCFLYKKYNAMLQIGGSDQWGNISAGINLVYRLHQKTVFGLTVPLLLNSNGMKFGKTESGTIWLDKNKTSVYTFYQFWMKVSDEEVFRYLRLFTLLNDQEIEQIKQEKIKKNDPLYCHRILARNITMLVHGKNNLNIAERITECLFSERITSMNLSDFELLKKDGINSVILNGTEDLREALVLSSLSPSKSQATVMIKSKAIRINNKIKTDYNYFFKNSDKLFYKFTLLSRGKRHHSLLCW